MDREEELPVPLDSGGVFCLDSNAQGCLRDITSESRASVQGKGCWERDRDLGIRVLPRVVSRVTDRTGVSRGCEGRVGGNGELVVSGVCAARLKASGDEGGRAAQHNTRASCP